jgi:hypothetical protein
LVFQLEKLRPRKWDLRPGLPAPGWRLSHWLGASPLSPEVLIASGKTPASNAFTASQQTPSNFLPLLRLHLRLCLALDALHFWILPLPFPFPILSGTGAFLPLLAQPWDTGLYPSR